jgi:dimethylaniline monooxygenase (N-oxide forming)
VIFATGYSFSFPYLEEGKLAEVRDNRVTLYKLMFPPDLAPRNTLALIGLIQPTGSISSHLIKFKNYCKF